MLQSLIKDKRAKSLTELTTSKSIDITGQYLSKSSHGHLQPSEEASAVTPMGPGRLSRSRDRMATQRRTSRSLDIDDSCFEKRYGEMDKLDVEHTWKKRCPLTPQQEEPCEDDETSGVDKQLEDGSGQMESGLAQGQDEPNTKQG